MPGWLQWKKKVLEILFFDILGNIGIFGENSPNGLVNRG